MTSVVCLNTHLDMSGSECLNMSDDHPLENCLSDNGAMLKSDCDEQLIISLAFNQVIILSLTRGKYIAFLRTNFSKSPIIVQIITFF